MGEILAAVALGVLIAAVALAAWFTIGFVVAVIRWIVTPPPPPAPGADCVVCTQLQALWLSMSYFEKVVALASFVAAAYLCNAVGCTGIALTF